MAFLIPTLPSEHKYKKETLKKPFPLLRGQTVGKYGHTLMVSLRV
jgi:hypothetical protein